MDQDLVIKLKERYVKDLQKPGIDKFERAKIIRSLLNDKKMSIREMAKQYDIPRSTIEDWLLYEKIDEGTYKELVDKGLTPKSIYQSLREGKRDPPTTNPVDIFLIEVRNKIRSLKPEQASSNTKLFLDELVNAANSFHCDINLKEKRKK